MKKQVYVVIGDIGATKELLLAMPELSIGIAPRWFADPGPRCKGKDLLQKQGIEFEARLPGEDDNPGIIVVGASATAVEAQIAWTRFGRERDIPVLWYEDLPGTGEVRSCREVSPNCMLVTDQMAAQIASSARPDMAVTVAGKPTFAKIAPLFDQVPQIRFKVRSGLGVEPGATLITYWSDGNPDLARVQLQAVCGIDLWSSRAALAPRLHPKLPDQAKAEFWEILGSAGIRVIEASGLDPDQLTLASDINIGSWGSTQCYASVLAGLSAIIILAEKDQEERFDRGYTNGKPPLVASGAAWGAESALELDALVNLIASTPDKGREFTARRRAPHEAMADPGSASRIAEEVIAWLYDE